MLLPACRQAMPQFSYSPLPHKDSIRLLHLFPGTPSDALVGRIEIVGLGHDTATATPFEAISYVWGSNTKDKDICINATPLPITTNLSIALRQCRLPDKSRALWADSVCINQVDLEEKGRQVALMARIYSASQCTLICLGHDCHGHHLARPAAASLCKIGAMMDKIFRNPSFSWELDSFPYPHSDDPILRPQLYEPLQAMLRHPWFTRGWVVQEASLGREALILWSDVSISLIQLLRVSEWLARCKIRLGDFVQHLRLPLVYHFLYQHRRPDEAMTLSSFSEYTSLPNLLEVLDGARMLSVTEARDRIYAFCSLPFVRDRNFTLEPDYQQPLQQVYRDFAIEYARANSSLDILSYVGHDRDPVEEPLYNSWAPRWDNSGGQPRSFWFPRIEPGLLREGPNGQAFMVETENDKSSVILRTRGVIFDQVSVVSDPVGPWMTFEDIQALWKIMRGAVPGAPGRLQSAPFQDCLAFLHALAMGNSPGPSAEEWIDLMRVYAHYLGTSEIHPLGSTTNHSVTEEAQHLHGIHSLLVGDSPSGRRVIRLAGGLYGSAQDICKTGDTCALIFGASTLLILRRISGKDPAHYRVLGPAYVNSREISSRGFPFDLTEVVNECAEFEILSTIEGWEARGICVEDILLE